jgi:hypothetical protein
MRSMSRTFDSTRNPSPLRRSQLRSARPSERCSPLRPHGSRPRRHAWSRCARNRDPAATSVTVAWQTLMPAGSCSKYATESQARWDQPFRSSRSSLALTLGHPYSPFGETCSHGLRCEVGISAPLLSLQDQQAPGLPRRSHRRERGELIDHVFASHRLVNPDNIPAVEIVAAGPLPSMPMTPKT